MEVLLERINTLSIGLMALQQLTKSTSSEGLNASSTKLHISKYVKAWIPKGLTGTL